MRSDARRRVRTGRTLKRERDFSGPDDLDLAVGVRELLDQPAAISKAGKHQPGRRSAQHLRQPGADFRHRPLWSFATPGSALQSFGVSQDASPAVP